MKQVWLREESPVTSDGPSWSFSGFYWPFRFFRLYTCTHLVSTDGKFHFYSGIYASWKRTQFPSAVSENRGKYSIRLIDKKNLHILAHVWESSSIKFWWSFDFVKQNDVQMIPRTDLVLEPARYFRSSRALIKARLNKKKGISFQINQIVSSK